LLEERSPGTGNARRGSLEGHEHHLCQIATPREPTSATIQPAAALCAASRSLPVRRFLFGGATLKHPAKIIVVAAALPRAFSTLAAGRRAELAAAHCTPPSQASSGIVAEPAGGNFLARGVLKSMPNQIGQMIMPATPAATFWATLPPCSSESWVVSQLWVLPVVPDRIERDHVHVIFEFL
jgi:hypothetical protein